MNIVKILLIVLATVIAIIATFAAVGMVLNLLSVLFWLAVICIVIGALVKLFGGQSGSTDYEPGKLEGVEHTLDEYRRKLEAEVKQSREKQR
ncbi:MAG: hypothetical protein KA368_04635 [Acidobacteria bacterium]|nr:hypothetical protein [Acidobacteriota bacterium]